jgi:hypothetical protein
MVWETLAQSWKLLRICALFKAHTVERAWKGTGDRSQRTCYLSTDDHYRKIRDRKQRTGIGKHFFVNMTIKPWNHNNTVYYYYYYYYYYYSLRFPRAVILFRN